MQYNPCVVLQHGSGTETVGYRSRVCNPLADSLQASADHTQIVVRSAQALPDMPRICRVLGRSQLPDGVRMPPSG